MGGIGPALTDTETLHGGGYSKILTVITNGVEEKGMPRWIVRLGPEKVFQVAAYVYTIRGTRPPGKKGAIRFSIIALVPGAALLRPEAEGP
jgi:cytochrome c oxidase cbb3-type subunit 3